MDSSASVSLVNDITLLRNLPQVPRMHISGIGGQELSSNLEGQWGPFQRRPATSSTEAVEGYYILLDRGSGKAITSRAEGI